MGINTDFTAALPTALMRPLSGSGSRAMMIDTMKTYGPDSSSDDFVFSRLGRYDLLHRRFVLWISRHTQNSVCDFIRFVGFGWGSCGNFVAYLFSLMCVGCGLYFLNQRKRLAMAETEFAVIKECEHEQPIPSSWRRPTFVRIVAALANADYKSLNQIEGVLEVSNETRISDRSVCC